MSNRGRVLIFQLNGQQKTFHITNEIDALSLIKLIRGVFGVNEEITGLQDQKNIYDVRYFCNNIARLPGQIYQVVTHQEQISPRKHNKRKRNGRNPTQPEELLSSSNLIPDFSTFIFYQLPNLQQNLLVLLFDQVWQANAYAQRLIDFISSQFAIQVYFTVYSEKEWSEETVLLTFFSVGSFQKEWEFTLQNQIEMEISLALNNFLEQSPKVESEIPIIVTQSDQRKENDIPIIVTRGDQRQVFKVEPNENFHSSEGKRQQSLMRIKREVEKVRSYFTNRQYEALLDLIVTQDPALIAAYQLYQRIQKEEQFISNLKALVPSENEQTNQNQEEYNNSKTLNHVVEAILNTKNKVFSRIETGMLKELSAQQNVELQSLIEGLRQHDQETICQVLKPYLTSQFLNNMRIHFTGSEMDWIFSKADERLSPINAAFSNFEAMGDLDELINTLKANVLQSDEWMSQYSFPPKNNNEVLYSQILQQKGDHRGNTFKFTIVASNDGDPNQDINQINRRKKSDEEIQLQSLKDKHFIDKFHSKEIKYFKDYHVHNLNLSFYKKDLMEQIENTVGFLEEEEKRRILEYYQNGNQRLRDVFDDFIREQNQEQFKQDLLNLLLIEEGKRVEEINSPVDVEEFESKMLKLKNFRFLLHHYYEVDKFITLRQLKTLMFLYVTEDISLLASYEVFCETKDQNEFISTLNLIYKLYSLGNHNHAEIDIDEIEQFDELIENQLVIIFMYRKYFNQDQRSALQKNVRAGDNTLLKYFKEFLRHRDKRQFLDQTRNFADERGVQLKKIEEILVERRQRRDEQKNEYKDIIEKLHLQFMKNKVRHLDMLLEAVDQDSLLIKSAFEVFDYTKDKQDLVENLVIIYHKLYKDNVKTILKSHAIEQQLQKNDLTKLLKKIESDDPILKGAFELYYITKDEAELKDTICRLVKYQH